MWLEVRGNAATLPQVQLSPPRALRLLQRESFLVGLLALWAVALVVAAPHTLVRDSWMTLVSGREIARHGIPHVETLTAIAHGRAWIDQQWLAHLAFFETWRLGGMK